MKQITVQGFGGITQIIEVEDDDHRVIVSAPAPEPDTAGEAK